MRAYSYMSGARKDAKADAKRLAAEAAGIPVRTSDDPRQPIELDLSRVGGDRLLLEPRRGHLLKWRLRDQDTGGPGHADCVRNCKNGMAACPEEDDE